MQGGNDQMARQGCPHSDVGRFFIADFTDHEHLRVLAQQVPGSLGEIQSARFVDLGLHDARDDLFGGIFGSDDVPSPALGELAKTRVNGGGLAAAGRAGQQQQAGGLTQEVFQFQTGGGGKIQL